MNLTQPNCLGAVKRKEDGLVATVFLITLLAILAMIVAANSMALIHLHNEVKHLEQQQVKRLNGTLTNSVPLNLNNPAQK